MKDLRINLDDVDFDRLAELGRSVIPGYAPTWTDHNIHDPGIMLVELLAWVADAQVYALSRTRRDERAAYAALMGLAPSGPRPAHGLIWPSTAVPFTTGTVLDISTVVTPDYPEAPKFHLTQRIQLTAATLGRVTSELADGTVQDWTRTNAQDGATFRPFGASPAPGDRLVLELKGPVVGPDANAPISIGVEIAPTDGPPAVQSIERGARLTAAIEDSGGRRGVEIAADTTQGLSQSGVLLLNIDPRTAPSDPVFKLVIESATGGFLLPPHLQRIAPNVLPVEQLDAALDENGEFGNGLSDQTHTLEQSGLIFGTGDSGVVVKINSGDGWETWRPVPDLTTCGPSDRVYRLDPITGRIRFGNGVNGALLAPGSALQVSYPVSAGTRGNLPTGVNWSVTGLGGVFGSNSVPTAGGSDGRDLRSLESLAHQALREERPAVSADDLEQATLGLSDLAVSRVRELPTASIEGRYPRGTRVLVAVGPHDVEAEQGESAEWLQALQTRLAPRLPLGQRLLVIPPRYVDVAIHARLVATRKADPDQVRQAAAAALHQRLRIVAAKPDDAVWPFGRDIAPRSVLGWLRGVAGVARVVEVRLLQNGTDTGSAPIKLGATGLPRFKLESDDISVARGPVGSGA